MSRELSQNPILLALYEEYEKVSKNYLKVISEQSWREICKKRTKDPECGSIKAISEHILLAGYVYISLLSEILGKKKKPKISNFQITSTAHFNKQSKKMMKATKDILQKMAHKSEEELCILKVKSSWGSFYDVEQLLEHAIVHILRHRRQVENLLKDL